jgi:hypothetical protein
MPKAIATVLAGLLISTPGRAASVQEASSAVGLSADGTRLLAADGTPLVLRGVNWGWWGCVESGDAELLRAWGGNLVRISFPYSKLVLPGTDEVGGEGLRLLDAMVEWAEEAGVWFILDCQETPGGNNTAHHCLGGRNALWREAAYQDQLARLWETLAARYRDRTWLLAYELMNEPTPPEDYTMEQYHGLLLRLIDVLRAVDAQRFVVVSGWRWSDVVGLTEALVLPRPRLIYTFHCYTPGQVTHEAGTYPGRSTLEVKWLGNSPEAWGLRGDADWTLLEKVFQAPADATHGQIMLRSDSNTGSAWFDDVSLTCVGQAIDLGPNPDLSPAAREKGWKVMRETAGEFTWDAVEGHDAPGSLCVSGTDSYNAWMTIAEFAVQAGAEYGLRCWVKAKGATGHSYPSVAWFRHREEVTDRAWLEARLRLAVEFSARHRVPVWCGEFGCSQANPDGSGVRWVRDAGELLNRLDIPWTYWNWRETTGRGSMAVWVQQDGRYVTQGPLAEVLQPLLRPAP